MNKTERKNKINVVINWPTNDTYFTVKDLQKINPNCKTITLRVKLDKAKNEKSVELIGYKNGGHGRPELVLAMTPVSQEVKNKAFQNGIQPSDGSLIESHITVSTSNIPNVETNNTIEIH